MMKWLVCAGMSKLEHMFCVVNTLLRGRLSSITCVSKYCKAAIGQAHLLQQLAGSTSSHMLSVGN